MQEGDNGDERVATSHSITQPNNLIFRFHT